ncbi:hypothetical protein SAMD00023353_4301000 [Rosellinia necatrix]|uniref:Uncharacterized protein n=1 Tax=Rosellinia necatrix TaxID=77044 RepID=A0A1W2TNW1_ROSNE|nr:hypothetical protein SAMD00023353_4301000 [Rosellinia necatrix]
MANPLTTPAPTLPANWAPTASGCLRSDDYWIWQLGNTLSDARTVLGGPSQTDDCFASVWKPTMTFAGSGCPPLYTSACRNSDSDSGGAVTCCPSIYDFACQPEPLDTGVHAEWFRCVSKYDSQGAVKLTRTDFRVSSRNVETRTKHMYEHLFALAILYTTPLSTSASSATSLPTTTATTITTTTTTPTSPPAGSSSPGLTAGAAAGIGVGVTAAVALLALLAWFMYRRRRRAAKPSGETPQFPAYGAPPGGAAAAAVAPLPPMALVGEPSPLSASTAPTVYTFPTEGSRGDGLSPYPAQYQVVSQPKEMLAEEGLRFELDGSSSALPRSTRAP